MRHTCRNELLVFVGFFLFVVLVSVNPVSFSPIASVRSALRKWPNYPNLKPLPRSHCAMLLNSVWGLNRSFPAGGTPSFMNFDMETKQTYTSLGYKGAKIYLHKLSIDDEVLLSARRSSFHRSFALQRQGFATNCRVNIFLGLS